MSVHLPIPCGRYRPWFVRSCDARSRRCPLMPRPRVAPAVSTALANVGNMSGRVAVVAIDAVQPRVVADFWCSVLGWQVLEEDDGVISIAPPDGSWPMIDVVPVPENKTVKNRLHLNLRADGMPTADELERLLDLGARHVDVGQAPGATWVVLSDPEGNESCLLSRIVQEARPDQ